MHFKHLWQLFYASLNSLWHVVTDYLQQVWLSRDVLRPDAVQSKISGGENRASPQCLATSVMSTVSTVRDVQAECSTQTWCKCSWSIDFKRQRNEKIHSASALLQGIVRSNFKLVYTQMTENALRAPYFYQYYMELPKSWGVGHPRLKFWGCPDTPMAVASPMSAVLGIFVFTEFTEFTDASMPPKMMLA